MTDIAAKLQAAIARHLGAPGTIADLKRLTGGATKITWSFSADIGGQIQRLILQQSPQAAEDRSKRLTPRIHGDDDARLMTLACAAGVPAPRVRLTLEPQDGMGAGYVTDFVAGETLGPRILREPEFAPARAAMAGQCGTILAAVHRIDPAQAPFLMEQDGVAQIAAYRRIVDHHKHVLPALELGLRWAADHVPRRARRTVVHGDFRTGNLIVDPGTGLAAVIDWEVAQIGDPMQDLGWLCVKTWRFGGQGACGGFATREVLFAAYERASGLAVDPAHVRFWEAFGCVKWAIMCLRKGLYHLETGGAATIEAAAIGRRIEEPLLDFLNLIEGRD